MSPENKGQEQSGELCFFYQSELMDRLGLIQSQSRCGYLTGLRPRGVGQETGKASTREAGAPCAPDPLPTEPREQ